MSVSRGLFEPALARFRFLLDLFRRDERGAYAIEFGILVMPFFGLLFAILEVGWVTFSAEELQAAVDRAARQIVTGQAQGSNYPTPAAFVSGLLCPGGSQQLIPSSWDCSLLTVDVRMPNSFGAADMTNSFYGKTTQYCLGVPSAIVVLRVAYPLPAVFPLSIYNKYIGLTSNVPGHSGWYHILMGSAAFKTEAFGSSSSC